VKEGKREGRGAEAEVREGGSGGGRGGGGGEGGWGKRQAIELEQGRGLVGGGQCIGKAGRGVLRRGVRVSQGGGR